MKKQISFSLKMTVTSFIVLAIILFISSQSVRASVNSEKDLVMFTVGSNGTIIKKTLSESDWQTQTSIMDNTLLSADFIDDNVGWLVGSKGTILHTTNGGLNWSKQISGTTANLQSVDFVNENIGWTVGGLIDGTILTTRNGGAVWELQTTLPERLNAVHFTDEDNGWVVGASGSIYHTSNAGMDWSRQDIGTGSNLIDVDFINDHEGWIIANNEIFFTNDKGVNWQLQASFTSFKENLYALDFIDENFGWAVGINGTIIHTRDGGLYWSKQYSKTNISFLDVAFINADVGWVVGAFGIIYYTDDGGRHWSKQNSNTPLTLHAIVPAEKNKLVTPHLEIGKKHVFLATDEKENIPGSNDDASLITVDAPEIVPAFLEKSTGNASVSSRIQLQPQKVSGDSRKYSVQVGAWKNQNYALEVLDKIKKYYPDAYIVVHNNYNKIRLSGILTKKQGVTVSMDIEEKFNMKPLLILNTQ